jgi:hypothetical protein
MCLSKQLKSVKPNKDGIHYKVMDTERKFLVLKRYRNVIQGNKELMKKGVLYNEKQFRDTIGSAFLIDSRDKKYKTGFHTYKNVEDARKNLGWHDVIVAVKGNKLVAAGKEGVLNDRDVLVFKEIVILNEVK